MLYICKVKDEGTTAGSFSIVTRDVEDVTRYDGQRGMPRPIIAILTAIATSLGVTSCMGLI